MFRKTFWRRFCLILLGGTTGWVVLGVVWGLAVINVVLKAAFFARTPKSLSMLGYLVMGWLAMFLIYDIYKTIGIIPVIMIAGGGLLYTIGAIIFFMEKPNPFPSYFGNHEIWHTSVLIANSIFYCLMLCFIAPFQHSC